MEGEQQQEAQPQKETPSVGFPQQEQGSGGGSKFPKWIFALIGIVVIVAVGGFFIFRITSQSGDTPSPSPDGQSLGAASTPTSQPAASPTPEPEPVKKSEIRVEVLNGTGAAGGASFLKNELEDLGFDNVDAGNADDQEEERTTVTFTRDVQKSVIDEITKKLEEEYAEVRTKRGTISGDFDIRILTGPRKGSSDATPTPTSTPEADADETE